jgi:hypothetical protein
MFVCSDGNGTDQRSQVNRRTKRGLVVGGAALAIVGGGGAALAAGGDLFGSSDRQAFLDDAAARLNVSSSDLQNALGSAFDDRVDAAVKAGQLTQAQGDALKARAKQSGGFPLLGGHGGPGFGRGPGFGHGPGGGMRATMTAAATYLGLTPDQLQTQLQSGKSLAQIAKAQNKTVAGLKQAMLDATKTQLAAAVKAGKLTQAQADSILAGLSSRLDDMIQNARPQFDGRLHFDGRGSDGHRFQFRGGGRFGSGSGGPGHPPGPPPTLPPAA